jgi:hypothetical protein
MLSFKSKHSINSTEALGQVKKRTILLIAVCVTVAIFLAPLLVPSLRYPEIPLKYDREIDRNFSSQQEGKALAAAEFLNYSAIVNSERFDGSSDPDAYLHPGNYLQYTYANFIDSEVINYYETRYNDLQGKGHPKQIELRYEANATKQSKFRIYNSPAPENVTWHNTTIVLSYSDGSVKLTSSGDMKFFFRNQSSYQTVQWEYDFNFSDCYVVEMKLLYSEVYAPLAGYWSDVYQIVVLDKDFESILVGLESTKLIS